MDLDLIFLFSSDLTVRLVSRQELVPLLCASFCISFCTGIELVCSARLDLWICGPVDLWIYGSGSLLVIWLLTMYCSGSCW